MAKNNFSKFRYKGKKDSCHKCDFKNICDRGNCIIKQKKNDSPPVAVADVDDEGNEGYEGNE